jgi:phosphatidylethanolamine-binding protein (PEBP) family uncharacterized protein
VVSGAELRKLKHKVSGPDGKRNLVPWPPCIHHHYSIRLYTAVTTAPNETTNAALERDIQHG